LLDVTDTTAGYAYPTYSVPVSYITPGFSWPVYATFGHSYTATLNVLFPVVGWCQSDVTPIVPPPCPAGPAPVAIQGKVTALENDKALANILMELRDGQGKVISTQLTQNSIVPGYNYKFDQVTLPNMFNGSYFVDPVVDRTEFASPLQIPVTLQGNVIITNPPGGSADFKIGHSPVQISVTDVPGTLVLITTQPCTGASNPPCTGNNAPDVNQTGSSMFSTYSAVIDGSGTALFNLPGNLPYVVTCWKPTVSGAGVTYTRTGNSGTDLGGTGAGGILMPNDPPHPFASCPP